jgi:hypothetical protein
VSPTMQRPVSLDHRHRSPHLDQRLHGRLSGKHRETWPKESPSMFYIKASNFELHQWLCYVDAMLIMLCLLVLSCKAWHFEYLWVAESPLTTQQPSAWCALAQKVPGKASHTHKEGACWFGNVHQDQHQMPWLWRLDWFGRSNMLHYTF